MKKALAVLTALMILSAAGMTGASAGAEPDGAAASGMRYPDHSVVFYEIFVGSFSDSDGDGTGDLRGIIRRMDYLNDGNPDSETSLGVEGLWLTPVFLSPSYHKYDVDDYYTVDPAFGTEEDLRELAGLCRERGVKLILDLPLNHTGRGNEWYRLFLKAHEEGDADSPWYDFYSWAPPGGALPSGRRFIPEGGILVEANFSDGMPELNFDSEAVREAVLDVGRYYLELGADGFRFDAAKYPYLGEPDKNIAFWTWYMEKLREIRPDVYAVAEVWDGDATVNPYLSAVNCFHFATSEAEGLLAKTAKGGSVNRLTRETEAYWNTILEISPAAMNIPFISNHDMDRAAGYLPLKGGKMAMAANLYLLTPGSPFIYYGEEIGLRGSRGGADTDANRRLHMPWGDGDTVRDPEGSSYDSQTRDTVRSQLEQPGSLLRHYQKLLRVRKEFPEIARGTYKALNFEDTKMGGFLCELDGRTAAVFHNTSKGPLTVNLRDAGVSGMEIAAVLETAESGNGAVLEDGILTLEGMTSVILR